MEDILKIVLQYGAPAVLGIGVVAFYIGKIRSLLKEIADVFIAFDKAFEDNTITVDELKNIKKEAIDVWTAVKAFGKK